SFRAVLASFFRHRPPQSFDGLPCRAARASGMFTRVLSGLMLAAVTGVAATEISQINRACHVCREKEPELLKRILSVFLLMTLAATMVFGQAKNKRAGKGHTPQDSGIEARLKKLEREWFDAVVRNDGA